MPTPAIPAAAAAVLRAAGLSDEHVAAVADYYGTDSGLMSRAVTALCDAIGAPTDPYGHDPRAAGVIERALLQRVLDRGLTGIQVQEVDTEEDAAQVLVALADAGLEPTSTWEYAEPALTIESALDLRVVGRDILGMKIENVDVEADAADILRELAAASITITAQGATTP